MKKVIYFSSTGFIYALVVAAMRSGRLSPCLPPERQQVQELLQNYHYEQNQQEGLVYDLGYSPRGEKCLALWSKGKEDLVRRTITSFLALFGQQQKQYQLVQIAVPAQPWLELGRFFIRLRPCRRLGYIIIHRCVLQVYRDLSQLATYP